MKRTLAVVVALLACTAVAETQKYVLMTTTGQIATLTVEDTKGIVTNSFIADDNGRGSKLKEKVELEKDGRPKKWSVEGKAWFGAPVKEDFTVEGGKGKWVSLDDNGEAEAKDAFYWPNNGTPYAQAALV
jgi:hypothetical protein